MSQIMRQRFNMITGSTGIFLGIWAGFISRDEQYFPT